MNHEIVKYYFSYIRVSTLTKYINQSVKFFNDYNSNIYQKFNWRNLGPSMTLLSVFTDAAAMQICVCVLFVSLILVRPGQSACYEFGHRTDSLILHMDYSTTQ